MRGLGERLCELLDCQTRFHAELRASLAELTTDIPEGTRAHLLGQARVLGEILDWCGAVHQDLLVEANRAVLGQRPIDLVDFVREVALDWTAANHVQVAVHGSCHQPWWGKPMALSAVVSAALAVVAQRIGRSGTIALEAADGGGQHSLRVLGLGEPRELGEPGPGDRLRSCVKALGARVTPDGLGSAGTGMVLHLPNVDCAPVFPVAPC
ncbi:MAG TPA: hypothetical protein VK348_11085 [Planctomycetota bacterium]|nr:hypothetical protein [Planctomycetota bacterium]